jgi:hypothetical protein
MSLNWIYENDLNNSTRYVLGIKGANPLICIGINPSTAEPDKLDRTLSCVERFAKSNHFDGWIMLNIYPQRATNPDNLDIAVNEKIHFNNLKNIDNIFKTANPTIWSAWGTIINKRKYLFDCLNDIYVLSQKYSCKWTTMGQITKKGHPHHPLYLNKNEILKEFDINTYINRFNVTNQ